MPTISRLLLTPPAFQRGITRTLRPQYGGADLLYKCSYVHQAMHLALLLDSIKAPPDEDERRQERSCTNSSQYRLPLSIARIPNRSLWSDRVSLSQLGFLVSVS
jgi:hypothetical protein